MRSPDLAQVIRRALDTRLASVHVGMPGRIEKFYPATQLADVKPLLKESFETDSGDFSSESLPVIPNVPVHFARGGVFVDTFPVAAGDECWLTFSDRSLDLWQAKGGEQDPLDVRRHDLTDCVAFVGVRSDPHKISEFDAARRVLGAVGGPRIAMSESDIQLGQGHGETATEAAVLGTTYTNDEASMLNNVGTQLLQIGTVQLPATIASLTTAASTNAVPIVGGILALPGFTAAISQLGLMAASIGQIMAQLQAFAAAQSSRLSTKVKVK